MEIDQSGKFVIENWKVDAEVEIPLNHVMTYDRAAVMMMIVEGVPTTQ